MTGKRGRKPRPQLPALKPIELIQRFFDELFAHAKRRKESSCNEAFDPLILRSDGMGYPTSSEAIRLAEYLAETQRAASAQYKAKFSKDTFCKLVMMSLGDTIAELKGCAAGQKSGIIEYEKIHEKFLAFLEPKLISASEDLYRHI